jgi:hypothetical protein
MSSELRSLRDHLRGGVTWVDEVVAIRQLQATAHGEGLGRR